MWTRTFHLYKPPELAAGLMEFHEEVTITVKYDVGAEDEIDTFENHMAHALAEWFDGARVIATTVPDA